MANSPVFRNLKEEMHPNGKLKLVSTLKDPNGDPLIEILPDPSKKVLKLLFVRSSPPEYNLEKLMNAFLCYAAREGYETVLLEDDAHFIEDGCKFRALMFRALTGKRGLYSRFEFEPQQNVTPQFNLLRAYTVGQARVDLLPLVPELPMADDRLLLQGILVNPAIADATLLGTYLAALPCSQKNFFLNKIDFLAAKIERQGRTIPFLQAYRSYQNAHGALQRKPSCVVQGGKRKSRRSLRRRARKTRRSR